MVVLLVGLVAGVSADCDAKRVEKTETFLSTGIKIRPGDVNNKFYDVGSPAGSFATVDFNAELVYENGDPVPLTDVYLHHWIMFEFTIPTGGAKLVRQELQEAMRGSGAHAYHVAGGKPLRVAAGREVRQGWAKGGETRHLNSTIPAPYGMVSGGEGLRTQWVLNVHGIDTRGAKNRMGCTECRYVALYHLLPLLPYPFPMSLWCWSEC